METCLLSQLLFQYLSRIFGSEKDVRARRLYYGVEDCCNIAFPFRRVNSGSKAEGLDFPGSDLDIMYIYLRKVVYPDVRSSPHKDCLSLFISTDDSAPGFAHIHFRINPSGCSFGRTPTIKIYAREIVGVHTENGIILQNSTFKNIFNLFYDNYSVDYMQKFLSKTHGPCQSLIDGSMDQMFSFKLHSWPSVASGWILRSRLSDWPTLSTISNIVHEDVLLVPIGSKFGSLEDNPNEWRISFSLAEKLLVHSFNHTQLMCYVLLKILLKEILNKIMITKNVLCSYFMKTILFWTIEETGCSMWIPKNLVKCFRACITKLLYLLRQKHLPNYFIPENNMIEGKLSDDILSNLCTLLDLVNDEGIGFTRKTDTLQDFLKTLHRKLTIKYQSDGANVLCSLLTQDMNGGFQLRGKRLFYFVCLNTFKTKLIRCLFYCFFLRYMCWLPLYDNYDLNRRNKGLYCNYKSSLGYSLIGANLHLPSWLSVAIVFYSHKNYNNTLKITEFIQSENLLMRNFTIDYENTVKRFLIRQKIKIRCCKSLEGTLGASTAESMIAKTDLLLNSSAFPSLPFRLCQSLMAFLRFMCFHHLKNVSKKTAAVYELFEIFEETFSKIDFSDKVFDVRYNGIYIRQCHWFVTKVCYMSHMRIPDNILIKIKRYFKRAKPSIMSICINKINWFAFSKQLYNDFNHWLCQQQ